MRRESKEKAGEELKSKGRKGLELLLLESKRKE